ncbi:hypothetical protein O181_032330 [Austropuccinia psidii MF-1]|uniref:Myb-binding protein 1A-like protein n=1 Tax=Austropuccinia psidii MF-1 TaxID=1389203 RepID=A0A9Q3CZG3_9BASI|nr:hypothetical protein [Austropuccinia psidii MF-1]
MCQLPYPMFSGGQRSAAPYHTASWLAGLAIGFVRWLPWQQSVRMSAHIMTCFGTLSSSRIDERVSAAAAIVSHLLQLQQSVAVDGSLDQAGCSGSADFDYTLKRLVRGLASPTPGARLGFSVALCEILTRFPQLSPETVFELIISTTPIQATFKPSEERDSLFGRLFGIKCIIQSGSLFAKRLETGEKEFFTSYANLFKKIVDELCSLMYRSSWFAESVGSVLVSGLAFRLLNQPDLFPWKSEALNYLAHQILIESKPWTLEKLSLAILLQQYSVKLDWKAILSSHFPNPVILSKENYDALFQMLSAVDKTQPTPSGVDTKSESSELPVRPHFIHGLLISACKSAASFEVTDLYIRLLEDYYFIEVAPVSRKSHGFLILIDLLQSDQIEDKFKPACLTPKCVHTLSVQLAFQDCLLHKMAKSVVSTLITQAEKSKNQESSLAKGFATQLRAAAPHFHHSSHTKLFDSLAAQMSSLDLELWVRELVTTFLQGSPIWSKTPLEPLGDDLDSQRTVGKFRQHVLSQLCNIIHSRTMPYNKSCATIILHCLISCAFFGKIPPDHSEIFQNSPKNCQESFNGASVEANNLATPLLPSLREFCKAKLYSCLTDLMARPSRRSDTKKPRSKLSTSIDSSQIKGLGIAIEIIQKHSAKPNLNKGGEIAKWKKAMRKTLLRIREQATNSNFANSRKNQSLVLLSETILLMSYDDQEGLEEALPLIEQLEKDINILLPLDETCKATGTSSPLGPVVANLIEILLFLLSWPVGFFRVVVEEIFDSFSDCMGLESIQSILNLLIPPEALEDDVGDDCSVGPEQNNSQNSDDHECSQSDDSDTTSDSETVNGSVDSEFRNEVAMALGHALAKEEELGDGSDKESELLDDDEMLALDSNLAALFQKQTGKKAAQAQNTQDLHLRMKLLDLVGKFVKLQPRTPILARLIQPLLDLIQKADPNEEVMKTKAFQILGEVVRIPCRLSSVNQLHPTELISATDFSAIAAAVHRIAQSTDVAQLADLCAKCNMWLAYMTQSESKGFLIENETHKALQELVNIHKQSLQNFCFKRVSKFRPPFFSQTVKRSPAFAWLLRSELLQLALEPAPIKPYRRQQMFNFLSTLLGVYPSKAAWVSNSCEDFPDFLNTLQDNLLSTLRATITSSSTEKEGLNDQGTWLVCIKELSKILVNTLRRNLKIIPDKTKVLATSPTANIRALLEESKQLQSSPHSEVINKCLQQLVSLTQISSDNQDLKAVKIKNKRKLGKSQEEEPEDNNQLASVLATDNVIGEQKSKKSTKRHKT